ncbi:MAG: hypothetical protein KKA52_00745, partial [Candidatus Omnitrophica bacterium]|nr:hypothetical protein [Candidatus Omnitrophota bacterium]
LPWPLTRKKLEEEIKAMGLELRDNGITRKQLALLMDTLRQEDFARQLQEAGIKNIRYLAAVVQDGRVTDIAVSISEASTLTVTHKFFEHNLQIRIYLIQDAINRLTHDTQSFSYIDEDGSAAMATAKELGLPKETAGLIKAIQEIASTYTYPLHWQGIQKFVLYEPEDNAEFFRIPFKDNDHLLALSMRIVPDLVTLHKTAPSLFTELIQAGLAHEGGIRGHMMKWPVKTDEVLKYFNWTRLTKTAAEILIQNFVDGRWDAIRGLLEAGLPPRNLWTRSLQIIKESLNIAGYDRNRPEPYGVTWKEYAAYYGMVKERGIRSVAVWFWFNLHIRKLPLDYEQNFSELYGFLTPNQRTAIVREVDKVQREYQQIVNPNQGSAISRLLKRMVSFGRSSVLGGVAVPVAGEMQKSDTAGFFGSWVFNTALLFVVVGTIVANIIMARRTTRSRTIRLLKSAVKKKDRGYSELGSFYNEAGYADKGIIIDTLVNEALSNAKEVNKEDLEPIFTFALGENVEGILGRVYDAVVSGLRLSPASGAMTTNDAEKVIRAVEKEVKKLKLGVDAERIASEIPLYILDFSQQRKLRDKDAFLQAVEAGTKKEINFAVQALRHKAAMAIRRLTEIEYHGSQRLITIIEKHLKDRNAAVREDIGAALRNLGVNVPLPIQMMKKPQAETKVQVVKREPESPQIPSSESSNGQITGPQENIKAMLETRTVRHKVDSDDLLIEKKEVSLPSQVVMCESSI